MRNIVASPLIFPAVGGGWGGVVSMLREKMQIPASLQKSSNLNPMQPDKSPAQAQVLSPEPCKPYTALHFT